MDPDRAAVTAVSPPSAADASLWAITSYFNPVGYERRLANYRLFRQRLGVPLIAVELSFDGEFELGAGDADVLLQLRGGDVMWQKERLLNLALRRLPRDCRFVAWIDCDVFFANDDWIAAAGEKLNSAVIVQLYSRAHYLGRDWRPGQAPGSCIEQSQQAVLAAVAAGEPLESAIRRGAKRASGGTSPGFAWAARRDLLDVHGLYDGCIMGGGDRALICATYGCYDTILADHIMNEWQRRRYLAWAEPFHASVRAAATYLHGDIFHLWHGDMRDRRVEERHRRLSAFGFNPFDDIALGDDGSWRWASAKPELHAFMRDYFAARREDG